MVMHAQCKQVFGLGRGGLDRLTETACQGGRAASLFLASDERCCVHATRRDCIAVICVLHAPRWSICERTNPIPALECNACHKSCTCDVTHILSLSCSHAFDSTLLQAPFWACAINAWRPHACNIASLLRAPVLMLACPIAGKPHVPVCVTPAAHTAVADQPADAAAAGQCRCRAGTEPAGDCTCSAAAAAGRQPAGVAAEC